MRRYLIFVLDVPDGYTLYFGNYTNPPIPEGWEHVEGKWDTGLVIEDFKVDLGQVFRHKIPRIFINLSSFA